MRAALVVALLLASGGCCATHGLWNAVGDAPVVLEGASVTGDGTLHLALRYEDGRSWLLTADIGSPREEWQDAEARAGLA